MRREATSEAAPVGGARRPAASAVEGPGACAPPAQARPRHRGEAGAEAGTPGVAAWGGRGLTVLGIESSCDDTAAAVVRLADAPGVLGAAGCGGDLSSRAAAIGPRPADARPLRLAPAGQAARGPEVAAGGLPEILLPEILLPEVLLPEVLLNVVILSSVVASQEALHAAFGGVVPEIAARAHAERLDAVTEQALAEAGLDLSGIDAVAVTAGPGLLGGVLAGVAFAKGIAAGASLPLVGVNHLAGHALTPRLTHGLAFPYLVLLVSGGHCQLLIARAWDRYERLGGTIDDAPGEAFDKVARALGLSPAGGPAVEAEAARGDPGRIPLPRPLLGRPGCDMSFSGLKTAVLRARDAALEGGALPEASRADLCAGFQAAVRDVLADRTANALDRYLAEAPTSPALAVAGGVAANGAVRAALSDLCARRGVRFVAPPLRLCTDNAAMIAFAGIEAFVAGHRDGLDLAARPRWPLDGAAAPMLGSGRKGAKA